MCHHTLVFIYGNELLRKRGIDNMALFKEITNQKGVTSRYFRISNVILNIDSKNIVITLKEYTDNTYRNKEKELSDLQNEINERQEYINTLNTNYIENEEEIIAKNNELRIIINKLNEMKNQEYYISEQNYNFDFEDKEYSLSICYELLKTLELFKDSKDV